MRVSIAIWLVLLLLGACTKKQVANVPLGKDEFWVDGLTLPPGSVEVTTEEREAGNYQMLIVNFNHSEGWQGVTSHFKSNLAKRGFQELKVPGLPNDQTKTYAKRGSPFKVSISDFSEVYSKVTKSYLREFRLTVAKKQ